MKPIAHIHTDLPQKFGIPRQSGLAPDLQGCIIFEPEYAIESAVRGLDGFSHLWIIWAFENGAKGGQQADIAADTAAGGVDETLRTNSDWSPTVRPPRLGGNTRMGVFATRSPFRPNPIGLSCVAIERVEMTDVGPVVHVLGADLRDGTPIYDIKPYIPYADCHPDATGGFTDDITYHTLDAVDMPEELIERIPAEKREALMQLLREDPRPPYHDDPERIYGMGYAGFEVRFTVSERTLHVIEVNPA